MANEKIVTLENLKCYHNETLQIIRSKQDAILDIDEIRYNANLVQSIGDKIDNLEDSIENVKIKQVNHGIENTTYTITPNVFNVWDTVDTLDITLGEELPNICNEYMFQFTSGETPTMLILPDNISWVNGFPTIESNKTYQCSILNGIGVIGGV